MKVGLVTVYNGYNYGSKLQAFAIQYILENKIGVKVDIINYNRAKDFRLVTIIRKIARKIERYIEGDNRKLKNSHTDEIFARKKTFDEFNKNYRLTPEICGYSTLQKIVPYYDVFVCGSDQIWSPDLIVTDFYTLHFVGKKKKTVSYAASFGIDVIPNKKAKAYQKFLNEIDIISVRENNGCDLVKKTTGKHSTWVLDPTLLLGREEWDLVTEKSDVRNTIDEKYILCYFLGANQSHRNLAEKLSQLKGYKIVSFPYMRGFNKADENLKGEKLYTIDPLQFISLVKNAEYICTDSFHATAFSIIYGKQFMVMKRYSDDTALSTNTRIVSLLEMFGLSGRLIAPEIDPGQLRDITKDEYSDVNCRLNLLRKKSLDFLECSLYEENH